MDNCQGYPCGIGIRLDASHNIVRENRVSGNFIGIGVGSGPDGVILINNTVSCNHATNNIYGIGLINSSYSVVENNIASNNSRFGIFLSSSSNSTITNNTVEFNNDCGINVLNSSNNTVTANTASSNNGSGIRICESERDIISNNLALNNSWGISLQYCNNSIIVSNNASFNRGDIKGDGINLGFCNNNTVSNNEASGNIDAGIQIMNSSNNNIITDNSANSNNYCGINVWNSSNNTVTANIANSNDYYGICLTSSSNNIIYVNNFINNTDNVYSYDSKNIWNSTEKITYTYKGSTFTSYMGNYWDDYSGSDANSDGIGDTPYSMDSDKDNYPLMLPWENYFAPIENKPPIASFVYSPKNPMIKQPVIFNASSSYDPDGLITKCEWDFGDGNITTGEVVMHSYASKDNYTVTLTVTDDEGATDVEIKQVIVYIPIMNLKIEPGGKDKLRVNFTTNLDDEFRVDLKVIDPDGIEFCCNPANHSQCFRNITIATLKNMSIDLVDEWGDFVWDLGEYTFYVRTRKNYAPELDARSNPDIFVIRHPEIEIDASKFNPCINETIFIVVRAPPYYNISIESSNPSKTVFEGGKGNYDGLDTQGPIYDVMDIDGINVYAVHFTVTRLR